MSNSKIVKYWKKRKKERKKERKNGFNFIVVSLIFSACEDLEVTVMIKDDVNNR